MKMVQQRIRLLILIVILLVVIIGILVTADSSQYAYAACRRVMLHTDGYAAWKLEASRFFPWKAQYDFYDGFNTATCEAVGFGRVWIGTKQMETLVGCMLSLDDTGGNECPREKFGVTP